jgi:hypothetical protein
LIYKDVGPVLAGGQPFLAGLAGIFTDAGRVDFRRGLFLGLHFYLYDLITLLNQHRTPLHPHS